ncbi:MAG: histidine phosphatase family protein, partial [Mesorhizobium sp.]
MSKLYLLRHAKAGWALPGMRDFDRPLDASGIADAETMGAAMRARSYIPDLTLCSNAKRARQTLEAGYLNLIRSNGGPSSLLVIGHNPMTEDLTIALSGDGDESARGMLNHGFPTSGLAVVRFDGSLADAAQGTGYLDAFLT